MRDVIHPTAVQFTAGTKSGRIITVDSKKLMPLKIRLNAFKVSRGGPLLLMLDETPGGFKLISFSYNDEVNTISSSLLTKALPEGWTSPDLAQSRPFSIVIGLDRVLLVRVFTAAPKVIFTIKKTVPLSADATVN